ncbi:MAG: hypothetical protein DRH20_11295 [Deltaproteobacteria bacterium]|nr:MAG: hypothetical protein DRH20_11295 [Deltaproteobacteria bacterium]
MAGNNESHVHLVPAHHALILLTGAPAQIVIPVSCIGVFIQEQGELSYMIRQRSCQDPCPMGMYGQEGMN